MLYIAHRINTIEELKSVPLEFGVELDLRDNGNQIIIQHDPFKAGTNFEEYLKSYNHELMICNVKSERIENRVKELLSKFNIHKYFFLDSSFPMIIQLSNQLEKNIAVRFSEFETIETVLSLSGKIDWVWVDCFTKFPLDNKTYNILKSNGFKLCLVSPELQGRKEDIELFKNIIINENIIFDAICTKLSNIPIWKGESDA
ncbi:MAG: hypothetical protein SH817_19020 [Leptospira sp.]|nr:hypothetical protein [Leptospira sp.]